MDPVTTAIVAAIVVGTSKGVTKVSEAVISDGYESLKGLIKRKYGEASDIVEAIKGVENKPDSSGRRKTLEEEVISVNAIKDEDILKAAKDILIMMEEKDDGKQILTTIGERSVAVGGNVIGSSIITGDNQS